MSEIGVDVHHAVFDSVKGVLDALMDLFGDGVGFL